MGSGWPDIFIKIRIWKYDQKVRCKKKRLWQEKIL